MKNIATTKYFSNINNYLFTTSHRSWYFYSKYKHVIESINLQHWLSKDINLI